MNAKRMLDKLDCRILELLQQNARTSNTEIGKRVGLSQPAVTARIQKLEEDGIIEGYAARINPRRAGLEISALIRLKTTHDKIESCLRLFAATPAIIDSLAAFGAVSTSIVLASYPSKPVALQAPQVGQG